MSPRTEPSHDLVIPLPLRNGIVQEPVRIRSHEFTWQFARSGGPGGQNVNKVSSKALLRWNPRRSALPNDVLHRFLHLGRTYLTSEGDFQISSQRHRAQPMNMQDCLEKLERLILAAVPPPTIRRPTKPTRGSKERRLTAKKQNSQRRAQRQVRDHD